MVDKISPEMEKIIRVLPGYDPYAQVGSIPGGCWFDEDAARYVIEFVETCCTHVKGELAGTPLVLEPWEKSLFANAYGWKRKVGGTRRYREVFVFIPRGNAKTTLGAAFVCVGLYLDDEPGAELYSSASERDQARLCFDMTAGMIRNEPRMNAAAEILKYSIVVGDKSYKALSAEAGSKHGFNAQLVVNDELHAQKTPELTEVLMTSQGKRRQPLMIHLTTSDYEREGSVCNAKHDYASKVRDNIIEDAAFLPVIYEATREDDWTSPEVWAKANPNLGVSVPLEYIERECARAKIDPAYENTFKRLHLNIRTEQAFRLIQMRRWDACNGPVEIPEGASVTIGVDGASVEDMASAVVCHNDGEIFHLIPFYWCPQAKVREMEARGDPTYATWVNQGLLTATPGNAIDDRAIRKTLNELTSRYDVREVPYDPYNLTTFAMQIIEEDGIPMVEHRQGTVSMNEPMKLLVRLMLEGKLRHGGHPILRWNMANLAARKDASDNIRPDKAESAGKIDGAVGAIMAAGCAAAGSDGQESFYETHSVEFSE